VKGALRNELVELTGAMSAPGEGLVGKLLNGLLNPPALAALILVNRHRLFLPIPISSWAESAMRPGNFKLL
jgi:hypothetical protein